MVSLIGSWANRITTRFASKYRRKVSRKSKQNAKKRCDTCDRKGKRRSCFPAGTLVDTAVGQQPIERIESGELVRAYDIQTGRWQWARVAETYCRDYEGDLVTLQVEGDTIVATGGHPFWVVEGARLSERPPIEELGSEPGGIGSLQRASTDYGSAGNDQSSQAIGEAPVSPVSASDCGRWVAARDLLPEDVLFAVNGDVVVESVRVAEATLTTYNLQVDEVPTFAVGTSGVLVHNTSPSCPKTCKPHPCDKKIRNGRKYVKRCKAAVQNAELKKCPSVRNRLLESCRCVLRDMRRAGSVPTNANERCPDEPSTSLTERRKTTLRGGSPSDIVRPIVLAAAITDQFAAVVGEKDPALHNEYVVEDLNVDHILPLNVIFTLFMEKLECLSPAQQYEIANLRANMQVLSSRTNQSRQDKEWEDWKGFRFGKPDFNPARPAFIKEMIRRETVAKQQIGIQIDRLIEERFI